MFLHLLVLLVGERKLWLSHLAPPTLWHHHNHLWKEKGIAHGRPYGQVQKWCTPYPSIHALVSYHITPNKLEGWAEEPSCEPTTRKVSWMGSAIPVMCPIDTRCWRVYRHEPDGILMKIHLESGAPNWKEELGSVSCHNLFLTLKQICCNNFEVHCWEDCSPCCNELVMILLILCKSSFFFSS